MIGEGLPTPPTTRPKVSHTHSGSAADGKYPCPAPPGMGDCAGGVTTTMIGEGLRVPSPQGDPTPPSRDR